MSKFRLEFKLKQHTPIIHFQSDQSGATLRATELKPKLDRFLLENVEGIPFKENTNGSKSLDYKVKIEADLSHSKEIDARNPLFFGNMGTGEAKKFKEHSKAFKIEFFSFSSAVLISIKDNFEAFLANTNFGTRQSKGFGGFYIEGKAFDKSLIEHKVYSFNSTQKDWQEDIKFFYAFLRAGINTAKFRGIYAKAVIFSYAKSKNITWDKKAIKNFYLDNNQNIENEKLMRDLFGLSSSQSWMSYKATITKEDVEKKIDRFKSPITFKPIVEGKGMRIYFWADKSVEDILNREFLVNFERKKGLKLKTPAIFDFDEFFEFAFALDLSKHIDSEYHNNGQYTKLVRMFKEIKESK